VQPRSTSAAACSAAIITGEASACLQLGQAWTWPTQCKNQRALCTSLLRLKSGSLLTTMRNVGASLEGGSLVPRNNRPLHCLGLVASYLAFAAAAAVRAINVWARNLCHYSSRYGSISDTCAATAPEQQHSLFCMVAISRLSSPPAAARPRRCRIQSIEKV
jgi:hypothetical protein